MEDEKETASNVSISVYSPQTLLTNKNVEKLNKIFSMLSNRYIESSTSPYCVYFTRYDGFFESRTNVKDLLLNFVPQLIKSCIEIKSQANNIIVNFDNYTAANDILNIKELKQLGWLVYVPTYKITKSVVIKNVDMELSIEEITALIKNSNANIPEIVSIERMNRKILNKGRNDFSFRPASSIKITFKGTEMPEKLMVGSEEHNVQLFKVEIKQCSNCQKFGHKSTTCRIKSKCVRCAKDHRNCSAKFLKCANCDGSHKANNRTCTEYMRQLEINKIMTDQNLSYKQALEYYIEYNQESSDDDDDYDDDYDDYDDDYDESFDTDFDENSYYDGYDDYEDPMDYDDFDIPEVYDKVVNDFVAHIFR